MEAGFVDGTGRQGRSFSTGQDSKLQWKILFGRDETVQVKGR